MTNLEPLNEFESALINSIFDFKHQQAFPDFWKQIPYLRVSVREFTGVGCYTTFCLLKEGEQYINTKYAVNALSTDSIIKMEGLQNMLFYELSVTDGKLDFLEIVTLDEPWDGKVRKYQIVPNN